MPFFERDGKIVLFLHIPKTGGSSVEQHLGAHSRMFFFSADAPPVTRVSPQHYTIAMLSAFFGADFWHDAFTVVRNPFTRAVSEYHYQLRFFRKDTPPFEQWLQSSLRRFLEDPYHLDHHLRRQVDFIDRSVRIYRYEDGLELAMADVAQRMGFSSNLPLPRVNEFEKGPVQWTDRAVELVRHVYAPDFKRFGYSLEGPPCS